MLMFPLSVKFSTSFLIRVGTKQKTMIEDRTSHINSTGHLRDRCSPHCSVISDFICIVL